MSRGTHIATCWNCGNQWTVGDCVPPYCSPRCKKEHREWTERIREIASEIEKAEIENNRGSGI